jgi:hypothetical protein
MRAIALAILTMLAAALPARADPTPQMKALLDTPPSKLDLLFLTLNMHLLEDTIATPYTFYGFYSSNPGGEDKIVIRVAPDRDEKLSNSHCEAAIAMARKALDVDPETGETTVTGTTISSIFGSLGAPAVGDAAAFPEMIDAMTVIHAEIVDEGESLTCTSPLFSTKVDFPPAP